MICYNCGCRLSEHDFCTGCGVEVALYKKIMFTSNRLYNEGLDKASVRDLSGAIVSLRQSLKYNKNNIEARNLLGLVYFEMGEAVSALSEWVISKNLRPKKNIADDYIDMVQTNQSRLDSINQTIKKYNQALLYCYQNSNDLAAIQLKKVISLNPKYLRARQLLALLYINTEEWDKALKELQKCCQIDTNNTTTLRYLQEAEHMLVPEEGSQAAPRKKLTADETVRYQSGNETIIRPMNPKESKGISVLVNMGIGVVIGIAIACFLILPARIQSVKAGINDELRIVSEQSDAKTASIDELEQKVQNLTDENTKAKEKLTSYQGSDGAMKTTDSLLMAASAYLKDPEDMEAIAKYLEALDADTLDTGTSTAFSSLYNSLIELVGSKLAASYYQTGYESYKNEDFEAAIPELERAYQYDNTNGDALFYLANSYRRSGDDDKAKELYAQVMDNFPGTDKANKAETYLAEINNSN